MMHDCRLAALTRTLIVLLVLMAGCAQTPERQTPDPPAAPSVASTTWALVDEELWSASHSAAKEARAHARDLVDGWIRRVQERTETEFIPWYTGFWTQQWLSMKVGWYEMNEPDSGETPAQRLAEYLQEQYYERVLEPVGRELDPDGIADRVAKRYLQSMRESVRHIRQRYRLPQGPLDRRLGRIPAVYLYGGNPQRASLGELTAADDPRDIPAYDALLALVHPAEGDNGGFGKDRFGPIARQGADALAQRLALRGGASAVALGVGGVPGILISVGISGWQAIEHEQERPTIERQLRSNLDRALNAMRYQLLHDPSRSVMAAVDHMGAQVENGLLSIRLETDRLPATAWEEPQPGGREPPSDQERRSPSRGKWIIGEAPPQMP